MSLEYEDDKNSMIAITERGNCLCILLITYENAHFERK